jgi:NAD(P)H-dependent flavin oxidoreductase YrpB (nitropropane dioxygenase family)
MSNIFDSRYPIVCSAMNQVSDLKLALAVHQVGCVPSFLDNDISQARQFISTAESHKFILATRRNPPMQLMREIFDLKPAYIEIPAIRNSNNQARDMMADPAIRMYIRTIKSMGIKLILKNYDVVENASDLCDIVIVKGKGAAGTNNKELGILDLVRKQVSLSNGVPIIASGTICSGTDIDNVLNAGASAVAIGTAFALTEESRVDIDVKKKLISSSVNDISNIQCIESDTAHIHKNGIILGEMAPDDNIMNFTLSLRKGVQGADGIIYIGHSIQHINSIVKVSEYVNELVESSKFLSRL